MDAITDVPLPANEPIHDYAPGSGERTRLTEALRSLSADPIDLPHVIGGIHRMGGGERVDVVQPHRHSARLGTFTNAEHADASAAIEAAIAAKAGWEATPFDERAAVFLRAADLMAGPWREKIAAATMLGQSKTAYQAEIDSACELIDFWRFNVAFARQILAQQPISARGVWNRTDYRPLEGFVYAITPFNFTAIAGNLPTAPALMGNTVVWKPSPTQTFAAYLTMQLLEAAGLPPGVINLLTGDGIAVSDVALADPRLAGIHFTGSTGTFQHLWREVGTNIDRYHTYPRLVGETGGKDFVVAHSSARPGCAAHGADSRRIRLPGPEVLCGVARIRPALGVAADGRRLPVRDRGVALRRRHRPDQLRRRADRRAGIREERQGDRAGQERRRRDDRRRRRIRRQRRIFRPPDGAAVRRPDRRGVPHGVLRADPVGARLRRRRSTTAFSTSSTRARSTRLTGAVIADDRAAVLAAEQRLRHAAGNFYVNDKPTGAVVGQQPFGGSRASGTNDKAGSALNLLRWTSARSIKETFVPPTDHDYPHMGTEMMPRAVPPGRAPGDPGRQPTGRIAADRRAAARHS